MIGGFVHLAVLIAPRAHRLNCKTGWGNPHPFNNGPALRRLPAQGSAGAMLACLRWE